MRRLPAGMDRQRAVAGTAAYVAWPDRWRRRSPMSRRPTRTATPVG